MTTQPRKSDAPLEVVESAPREQHAIPRALASSFEGNEPALRDYIETILHARYLIIATTVAAVLAGLLYFVLATPKYLADALVQVEEKKSTLTGLQDLSDMFQTESAADAEMEILRSRMLLGTVMDELHLDVVAEPRFFPLVGRAVARHHEKDKPASPLLGMSSFAWGGEWIAVDTLNVPDRWKGKRLTLVARRSRAYDLLDPAGELLGHGDVGKPLAARGVNLFVSDLVARDGTQFRLTKVPRQNAFERLQKGLVIAEQGKKTGVIRVSLEGPDPERVSAVIDAIAQTYLRQNVERKSAEAAKTLAFIRGQLPQLKANVLTAEDALNAYRQQRGGGIDLSAETKAALDRAADIEKSLTDIELQRLEVTGRFTANHPVLQAMNKKTAQLEREKQDLERRFKALPETESNAARLMRDVQVASDLYLMLMNKAQELQVMKSGAIGNVRILDTALMPRDPVSPQPFLTLGLSLLLGVTLGVAIAFVRKELGQGVEDPELIERETGIPVYASIPHSPAQASLPQRPEIQRKTTLPVLAATQPDDLAVEALRSLRTSLQFALADASNNVVAIAGPSPSIGKSFVAVNLAHVLADVGQRVLLVDADLRRGHLHRYFGTSKAPGLADIVRGTASEKDAIRKPGPTDVHFLPMGERPPNPSELLSSSRFAGFVTSISREYDLVLIDTAPVLAVTDGTLACRPAGTTLLLLRGAQHPVREIAAASKRLAQTGVAPRAIILNDVMPKMGGYAYSKYGYHYHYEYK